MNLFIQHKTSEEQPKESNWYPTDRGLLYYFVNKENWSCRDDRLSPEYPWLWYEKTKEVKSVKIEKKIDKIVLYQEWFEDEEDKTGWISTGWNEPNGYELYKIVDTDKYDHPTMAIFKLSNN